MRKIGCIALALILASSTLGIAGCNRSGNGGTSGGDYGTPAVDESKTPLYVYNFDGGVGTDWLYAMEAEFEAKYKDVQFQPGTDKVGVDLVIAKGKDTMTGAITSQPYDVIFTEYVPFNDMAAQGGLLPITDIVEESLSTLTNGAETATIESKLSSAQQAALTAIDGNYYVLPHYEAYAGLVYDAKVFTDYTLFFKEGGGWTGVDSEKTVGPDGVRGNYDDGLPSSIEELLTLMDRSANFSVAPFIWTGGYETYTSRILVGLDAALAGYDSYMLNFNKGKDSFVNGGTARIIKGFNGDTPVVEDVAITPENAYLLKQSESKYYALKVLAKILSNSKYYSDKITGVLSHLEAQGEYIYSDLENEPIAMLIEGSYWYNEASDYFKRSENTYKDRAKNRQFAWMPLPTQVSGSVKEGEGKPQTLVDSTSSYAFINARIANDENIVKLAKLFLQYCYTNDALQKFVTKTRVFKGVTVDMTGIDISSLDYYTQSLIQLRQDSKIAYPVSDNKIYVKSAVAPLNDWQSVVKGVPYSYPINGFKSKVSAKDYFMGTWIAQSTWENANREYFQ